MGMGLSCGTLWLAAAAYAAVPPDVAELAALTPGGPAATTHVALGRLYQLVFDRAQALQHFSAALAAAPEDIEALAAYTAATPDRALELALFRRMLRLGVDGAAVRQRIQWLERLGDRAVNRLESPYAEYALRMPVAYSRESHPVGWMLEVRLNDSRPLRLLLDTGARGILINAAANRQARLERLAETQLDGFGDGPARTGEVLLAESMRVGGVVFSNVIVEAANVTLPADLDGLIGLDVFRQFAITLDGKRSRLRLAPLAGSSASDGEGERPTWRHVPAPPAQRTLLQAKHLLVAPVQLDGKRPARFALDSGAAYSLLRPPSPSVVALRQVGLQGLSGFASLGEAPRAVRVELPGGGRAVLHEAVYADLSELSASFGLPLDGLLGFPALRRLVTTIDLRSGSLHVAAE